MTDRHISLRFYQRSAPFAFMGCALLLGACQQSEVSEPAAVAEESDAALNWARAALERNPRYELIATDSTRDVFTLRDKSSGEVRTVKLEELAAAPLEQLSLTLTEPARSQTTSESAAAPPATEPAARESESEDGRVAAAEPQATAPPADAPQYTIERSDGQVRVSGPGVSIVSAGGGQTGAARGARTDEVEPIICEGRRMVHFDGRQIYVDGDAITVRGGCEMYITNSRIVASGTGVVVRDGVIHVSNSYIEGAQGSFEADDQAKLYLRASTFAGLPRRSEQATLQDQGGNRWR